MEIDITHGVKDMNYMCQPVFVTLTKYRKQGTSPRKEVYFVWLIVLEVHGHPTANSVTEAGECLG